MYLLIILKANFLKVVTTLLLGSSQKRKSKVFFSIQVLTFQIKEVETSGSLNLAMTIFQQFLEALIARSGNISKIRAGSKILQDEPSRKAPSSS